MGSLYLVFLLSTYAHAAQLANSSVAIAPLFVPDPVGRGTVGILLNCFFTLSICVWTALHLNIDHRPMFKGKLWKMVKYVALGIFWPETVLFMASGQWLDARNLVFRMRDPDGKYPGAHKLLFSQISDQQGLTMEVAFYAMMGGFVFKEVSGDSDSFEEYTLQISQFEFLVQNSDLFKLNLEKLHREVESLSNNDQLAKVLACLQASWFVLQCFARDATGLTVTLIEIHTATHVMCALAVFIFWLRKPQYVTYRIDIDVHIEENVSKRLHKRYERERVKNFNFADDAKNIHIALLTVFSVAYGAVHLAAWNAHFPTDIEQWMWRASSFLIIGWFPVYYVIVEYIFMNRVDVKIVMWIFGVLCGAARLFLLVEAFLSFRSLPLDAYKTVNWAQYWPHF
ncbi:hypothetical protein RUND412_008057 [Rhizina undulata]